MRTKSTLLFAAALASPLHAGEVPVAVSPGEPDRAALQRALRPSFSFTGVEGAVAYELALRAVEPEAVDADVLESVLELEKPL